MSSNTRKAQPPGAAGPSAQADGSDGVDWAYIEQQLNGIPADFKSQKFNSLKRVIEILSSANPNLALNELKAELDKCEMMIDSVVDSHHLGFNHAIQNYSKILKLFNESQLQVRSLKSSLEEARLRLGTHSSNLRSHWHTAVSLKDSISILEDVRRVVDDRAALEATIAKKDWQQASTILLRLANRLAIDELQRLGALSQIRADLVTHWHTIVSSLVADIQDLVFHRPPAMCAPVQPSGASAAPAGASGEVAASPETTANLDNEGQNTPHLISYHPRITALVYEMEQHNTNNNTSTVLDSLSMESSAEAKKKVTAQQVGDVKVQQLLGGLINLDSLHLLKSGLISSIVPQIKKVMEAAVHATLAHVADARDDASAPKRYFVPAHVHTAVQKCMANAMSQVLLVIRNIGVLFDLAASAGEGLASARLKGGKGMALLRSLDSDGSGPAAAQLEAPSSPRSPSRAASQSVQSAALTTNAEREAVWVAIQEEMLSFLALLIRAPRAKAQVKNEPELDLDNEGRGTWLAGILKDQLLGFTAGPRKARLTFNFESEEPTSAPLATATPGPSARRADEDADGYSSLVSAMTLGTPATPFLSPVVYPSLMHFCAEAGFLLGLSPTSDKRVQQARAILPSFLDDFMSETVLFKVLVDAKAQVTQLLGEKFAFKVAGQQRNLHRGSRTGRPVLPAVLGVESLLEELAVWSRLMPLYAEPLCSIATNMLLRLIDESDQVLTSLAPAASLRNLVSSQPLSVLLLRQPIAAHLADPLFFQAVKMDVAESKGFVLQNGSLLGQGGDEDFEELLTYYLSLRPIAVEDLVQSQGNMHTIINIAALADSCMYLVSSLQKHGAALVPGEMPEAEKALWYSGRKSSKGINPGASMMLLSLSSSPNLAPNLQHVVDRLKCEAGHCLRLLKVDMQLYVVSRVAELRRCRKLTSEDSMRDMDTSLSLLLRQIQRTEEQLAPYLPPEQLHFLLADLPGLVCKTLVAVLPEVEEVNRFGLDRMIRWMSVVKASMVSGASHSPAAVMTQAAQQQQFDNACAFCTLLRGSVSNVLVEAQDDFGKFSEREWRSLLDIFVTGRVVTQAHRQSLDSIIESKLAMLRGSADSAKYSESPAPGASGKLGVSNWMPTRTRSSAQ